jgi:hypothetical protein
MRKMIAKEELVEIISNYKHDNVDKDIMVKIFDLYGDTYERDPMSESGYTITKNCSNERYSLRTHEWEYDKPLVEDIDNINDETQLRNHEYEDLKDAVKVLCKALLKAKDNQWEDFVEFDLNISNIDKLRKFSKL